MPGKACRLFWRRGSLTSKAGSAFNAFQRHQKEVRQKMYCRGIRGATTVEHNTKEDIYKATEELLKRLIAANGINVDDIAYALFTTTPDLNAAFPAAAARRMGWTNTALLCGHEMNVPNSLQRCLRVLVLYNTEKKANEIVHVYINGAETLRSTI